MFTQHWRKIMAIYHWVYGIIHFTWSVGWLPVHQDQLRAQCSLKVWEHFTFLHHKCKCISDVTWSVSSNMTNCEQHQPPNSRHCDLRYITVTAYFRPTCLCCTVGKKVIAEAFKYWLLFHHMTLWYRSICCCHASVCLCVCLCMCICHTPALYQNG